MPQTKIYNVHVIEGSTIRKYTKDGFYTEDFHADIGNTRMSGTAEEIFKCFECNLAGSMSVDELREELNNGTNCIVIDHSIQHKTGQIIVHFTNEPEVIGQGFAAPSALQ